MVIFAVETAGRQAAEFTSLLPASVCKELARRWGRASTTKRRLEGDGATPAAGALAARSLFGPASALVELGMAAGATLRPTRGFEG